MLRRLLARRYSRDEDRERPTEPTPTATVSDALASAANGWRPRRPKERGERSRICCCSPTPCPSGGRPGNATRLPRPEVDLSGDAQLDRIATPARLESHPLPEKVVAIHGSSTRPRSRTRSAAPWPSPTTPSPAPRSTSTSTSSSRPTAGAQVRRRTRLARGRRQRSTSAALERDGQCRLWWGRNAVDLFFAYDAVPRGDAAQSPPGPVRARPRSRSSPPSTWRSARRCSIGPRTGSTSSRCSSRPTDLDLAEIERLAGADGRGRRSAARQLEESQGPTVAGRPEPTKSLRRRGLVGDDRPCSRCAPGRPGSTRRRRAAWPAARASRRR